MKKKFFFVLIAMLLMPVISVSAETNTLVPPSLACGSLTVRNNTYTVVLDLPPQFSQPGYEVRNANTNALYASGYMGYHAIATNIPINVPIHARVTDGSNWSGWSSTITCYHSTSGFAISYTCSYNSGNTYVANFSWSPNYNEKSTRVVDYYGTQLGYHVNGTEGISSPDEFVVPAGRKFVFTLEDWGSSTYNETGSCP